MLIDVKKSKQSAICTDGGEGPRPMLRSRPQRPQRPRRPRLPRPRPPATHMPRKSNTVPTNPPWDGTGRYQAYPSSPVPITRPGPRSPGTVSSRRGSVQCPSLEERVPSQCFQDIFKWDGGSSPSTQNTNSAPPAVGGGFPLGNERSHLPRCTLGIVSSWQRLDRYCSDPAPVLLRPRLPMPMLMLIHTTGRLGRDLSGLSR
jgi:hypothetical protein